MLTSQICKKKSFDEVWFKDWVSQLRLNFAYHRKLWEYVMICQALKERGLLNEGLRGIGFGVGQEPLPALFAKYGCKITATDLSEDDPSAKYWSPSKQHSKKIEDLDRNKICDKKTLYKNVEFQAVDMNNIPKTLNGYDFSWSSCSMEHLGSIEHGIQFLLNQRDVLKDGGWAIHTTEFNVKSNTDTLNDPVTVIFRKKDIQNLFQKMGRNGFMFDKPDYSLGDTPIDNYIDVPPYKHDPHLKIELGRYTTTSIILLFQKSQKKQDRLYFIKKLFRR